MEKIFGLLVLIVPFIIYFILNKSILKYFTKIYQETNKNPISLFHQIVGIFIYFPVIVYCIDPVLGVNPLVYGLIPLTVVSFLVVSNLHLKNPIRIVLVTISQIIFSMMFVARFLVWIYLLAFSIVTNIMVGDSVEITNIGLACGSMLLSLCNISFVI